jgi:hypothetical protein
MSCGIKKQKVSKQRGGSPASDLVMANLADLSSSQSVPQGCALKGDMNSLNLYQPSGGARRKSRSRSHKNKHVHGKGCKSMHRKGSKSRKSGRKSRGASKSRNGKKGKKSMKSNKRNSKSGSRVMRGGYGSDWLSTQNSLGNINAAQNTDWKNFSASEPSTRDMLMNPPTLGLAGSGHPMSGLEGANVSNVGAPLV